MAISGAFGGLPGSHTARVVTVGRSSAATLPSPDSSPTHLRRIPEADCEWNKCSIAHEFERLLLKRGCASVSEIIVHCVLVKHKAGSGVSGRASRLFVFFLCVLGAVKKKRTERAPA